MLAEPSTLHAETQAVPTAQASADEAALTASKALERCAFRLETVDQDFPFQCTISVLENGPGDRP